MFVQLWLSVVIYNINFTGPLSNRAFLFNHLLSNMLCTLIFSFITWFIVLPGNSAYQKVLKYKIILEYFKVCSFIICHMLFLWLCKLALLQIHDLPTSFPPVLQLQAFETTFTSVSKYQYTQWDVGWIMSLEKTHWCTNSTI